MKISLVKTKSAVNQKRNRVCEIARAFSSLAPKANETRNMPHVNRKEKKKKRKAL